MRATHISLHTHPHITEAKGWQFTASLNSTLNKIIPWIEVSEKLLVSQLVKKSPPPRVIWNPKVEVHCRVHNFVPILSLHRGQY